MRGSRRNYHIAVIDAGKTNKKVSVYSRGLKLIHKESTQIGELKIGGMLCDDIPAMNEWVLLALKRFASGYEVKVISATTFGATVVHLDRNGDFALPVISYMNPVDAVTENRFYGRFGSKADLYMKTGTPSFGCSLNVAKQLFWLKEKRKKEYGSIESTLFLPQYVGFFLTGKKSVELTSIGCHTYLYDFRKKGWSTVAAGMGAVGKIPAEISKPWDTLGTISPQVCRRTGLEGDCRVTVGIHDSNASLLPYLMWDRGEFILASTGTWGVFMYPGAKYELNRESLRRDVLYYIDPFGRPVKASRFACGVEHDHYSKLISKRFGRDPRKVALNTRVLREILESNDCFVVPALMPNTGQFPDSKPGIIGSRKFFKNIETAYHVLCLSLAVQSYFAINEILGGKKKIPIFIEGGFANNSIYAGCLSALFAGNRVMSTELKEATSLGAAICARCAQESTSPGKLDPGLVSLNEKTIRRPGIDGKLFRKYVESFVLQCRSGERSRNG